MLTKAKHYQRLSQVLDNAVGILAWVLMIHVVAILGKISYSDFLDHLALLVIVAPIQGLSFYVNATQSLLPHAQIPYLTKSLGVVLLGIFAVDFVTNLEFVSRTVVIGYAFLTFGGLFVAKTFLYYWYFYGRKERVENYTKILVVGSGPRAVRIAKHLRESGDWGMEIIGFIDPDPTRVGNLIDLDAHPHRAAKFNGASNGSAADHDQIAVSGIDDLQQILSGAVVDEVLIATPRKMLDSLDSVVQTCSEEGVRIRLAADVYDIDAARTEMSMLGQVPVVEFQPVSQNANMLIVKRIFDLVATLLALPLLIPLFLVIGIAVKLDTPGPMFFVQDRVGLNKRRFKMYKFRSMRADAEERLCEVEHLNEAVGPIFKIKNDPRVTRVGRFIRKTSLDELPQLINVVLGDMSLVGPRPMSVRDVSLFDQGLQRRRFSVRPGCTCIWQISGRSDLPFEDWLRLDLEYIERWSLWLDIKILFLTVPTMVKGSGAH